MTDANEPGPDAAPQANAPGASRPNSAKPHHRRRRRRERLVRGRFYRLLRFCGLAAVVFVIVAVLGVGGAEYYTGTPYFCSSCHIMEPYYDSWDNDIHGNKLGVRCVDCHYAPGERQTFLAKFKGLSQATSYFSGRAGAGRPRAHVNNESCLRSGCHADGEHLKKALPIGERRTEIRIVAGQETEVTRWPTVMFEHDKHLNVEKRLADTRHTAELLADQIQSAVDPRVFERIRRAAKAVGPLLERETRMHDLMLEHEVEAFQTEALELMRLEHIVTRLQQLADASCTACHTYDESGDRHMGVNRQACFTCHFTNQGFNTDTGACLGCHEPPVRRIVIHDDPRSASDEAPTMMDHRDIVDRNISCVSCHLDVVQGESGVTARECRHCHDQDRFLVGFEQRDTAAVEEYHRLHIAAQRAHCVDCHASIQHRLIDPTFVAANPRYIKPVIDNCQHCHPEHHQQQLQLLMGVGAQGLDEPMPNAMFGSRVNCRACHTESGSDFKGTPLIEATKATCVACHGADYEELYEQWTSEIVNYLADAESLLATVRQAVDELEQSGRTIADDTVTLINRAAHDIEFVANGNGIHNKAYALQLLSLAQANLEQARALLDQ